MQAIGLVTSSPSNHSEIVSGSDCGVDVLCQSREFCRVDIPVGFLAVMVERV